MKPIVINYKNRERIEKALEEAQGKAKERTINFFTILSAPIVIKKEYGITMKALEGCCFECDPNAQDFPRAYKYTPMSTHFYIEVSHGSFKLVDVKREECFRSGRQVTAILTTVAKDFIIHNMTIKAVGFYGCGYSGTLSAREICELGLFDEAVAHMDEAVKADICKERPYCTEYDFLKEYMSRHEKKYGRYFRF